LDQESERALLAITLLGWVLIAVFWGLLGWGVVHDVTRIAAGNRRLVRWVVLGLRLVSACFAIASFLSPAGERFGGTGLLLALAAIALLFVGSVVDAWTSREASAGGFRQ
jgi:hypothetical protein